MKKIAALLLALSLVLALAACAANTNPSTPSNDTAADTTPSAEPAASEDQPAGDTSALKNGLTIQIVPMSTASDYWNALRAGAEAAAEEFGAEYGGITILYDGPARNGDSQGQIDIMNNAVTAGVDGILLAATDPEALHSAVVDAEENGVFVCTVDSGVEPNDASSFICTDNVSGCKKLGEYMAEIIGYEGKYAIIGDNYAFAAGVDRPEGFNQGMQEYENIEYLGIQLANSDIPTAESMALNYLTANPDISVIFCSNDAAITGASNAFLQEGICGEVKLCSVDVSEDIISYIKTGMVTATVLQSPYNMGYEGVKTILALLNGQSVEKQVDAGTYLLTKDNLDTEEALAAIRQYLPNYKPE